MKEKNISATQDIIDWLNHDTERKERILMLKSGYSQKGIERTIAKRHNIEFYNNVPRLDPRIIL